MKLTNEQFKSLTEADQRRYIDTIENLAEQASVIALKLNTSGWTLQYLDNIKDAVKNAETLFAELTQVKETVNG